MKCNKYSKVKLNITHKKVKFSHKKIVVNSYVVNIKIFTSFKGLKVIGSWKVVPAASKINGGNNVLKKSVEGGSYL